MHTTNTTSASAIKSVLAPPNGNARMLERGRRSIAGGDSSTMPPVLPYHLPLVADRGEGAACGTSTETNTST